jgi:hypothetical protein
LYERENERKVQKAKKERGWKSDGMRRRIDKSTSKQFIKFLPTALSAENCVKHDSQAWKMKNSSRTEKKTQKKK